MRLLTNLLSRYFWGHPSVPPIPVPAAEKKYIFKCGHEGLLKKDLVIFGDSGTWSVAEKSVANSVCADCFAKAAIRCAWCGKAITPGEPVTLYIPKKEFVIPDYAVVYKKTPYIQLVGCLRSTCGEGLDRAGFLTESGKVQRAVSPLEMVVANASLGRDEVVIVENVRDPNKAVLVPDQIAKPGE